MLLSAMPNQNQYKCESHTLSKEATIAMPLVATPHHHFTKCSGHILSREATATIILLPHHIIIIPVSHL